MNLFRRISISLLVCSMVACSKSDADLVVPVAEPESVVIGCAGIGADIEVRTQIEDDLSVRWVSGDEIRLWARECGSAGFLSEVRNVPFRFDYYSPQWCRAGFTGTISGLSSAFDAEKSYDYYAVSPAPASDSDVVGTLVTCDIPSVQSGKFDGNCDILTARMENAAALKKGDNNPSINLKFRHHVHVMKFTVPQNGLGENIHAVELTFPQPVTGRMTVDMAGVQPDDLSGIDCDKVSVEFPKGEEKDAGDTFFVTIAPVTFDAGTTIGMRIIGVTGETSVDYTFPRPKVCDAEHLTPVVLHVPVKNTFYTVVEFKVVDNDRAEHAGKTNLLGVNTLGERVQAVRLCSEAGAFANAVRMSSGCSVSADGSVLTCVVPERGDGKYSLSFVSEKLAGSKCPWEKWNSAALSGKEVELEYESECALVKSWNGWKPVRTSIPAIDPTRIDPYSVTLSVPYLFEEDFSGLNGQDNNLEAGGASTSSSNDAKSLAFMGLTDSWSGQRIGGPAGDYVKISSVRGIQKWRGRMTAPCLLSLKQESHIVVSFDMSGYQKKGAACTCTFGFSDDAENKNWKYGDGCTSFETFTPPTNNTWIRGHSYDSKAGNVKVSSQSRLSWLIDYGSTGSIVDYQTYYLYIDNIKVSIVH